MFFSVAVPFAVDEIDVDGAVDESDAAGVGGVFDFVPWVVTTELDAVFDGFGDDVGFFDPAVELFLCDHWCLR